MSWGFARVFTSDDGWLLKGGQALLVRCGGRARYSRDIDLFRPQADDLATAVEALRTAAKRDLGDFFTFTEAAPVSHADETGGAKLKFTVLIGTRKVGTVNVDIVVRRSPTGRPTAVDMTPAVPIDWPDVWPQVLLYPLLDHLADKICAMYEWHATAPVPRPAAAIWQTSCSSLNKKQSPATPSKQPSTANESDALAPAPTYAYLRDSKIPDPTFWKTNYPPAAAEVTGLIGCHTLTEAAAAAEVFATPLLASQDPGVWNPSNAQWRQKGSE